jgi:hypothetical protein
MVEEKASYPDSNGAYSFAKAGDSVTGFSKRIRYERKRTAPSSCLRQSLCQQKPFWSHSFNHQPPGSYLLSFRVVGLLLRQSETAADKTRATIANGSVIRNFLYPGYFFSLDLLFLRSISEEDWRILVFLSYFLSSLKTSCCRVVFYFYSRDGTPRRKLDRASYPSFFPSPRG